MFDILAEWPMGQSSAVHSFLVVLFSTLLGMQFVYPFSSDGLLDNEMSKGKIMLTT